MKWIDSHAHLTEDDAYPEVEELLSRAQQAGITDVVNICTSPKTLERGISLAHAHPWIHNTAATTPHDVEKEGENAFPIIEKAARNKYLKAIGETGLDYHYNHSNPSLQRDFLRRYLHLAKELNLPVVIHCRDAFNDFFSILDEEYQTNGKYLPGVLHCFTGTPEEAREVVQRGWYLSLSGIVTFKKSEELRKIAREVPLDQLLIETDTPYLAPIPHRGKRNEPSFLIHTAKCIAQERNVPLEILAQTTTTNARTLFRI